MSLRVRMAIAAGAAVALAVFAVAVSSYAGMRAQLLGQVDQSLKDRVAQVPGLAAGGGPGQGGRPRGDDLGFIPSGGGGEGRSARSRVSFISPGYEVAGRPAAARRTARPG